MSGNLTFEQLSFQKQVGFVVDESMMKIIDPDLFGEVVLALTTICDHSHSTLKLHNGHITEFMIGVIPISSAKSVVLGRKPGNLSRISASAFASVASSWALYEEQGFHGLQVITELDLESFPSNASRQKYTLVQYVAAILHSMEAYFMFQRPYLAFRQNTQECLEIIENSSASSYYIAFIWKFLTDPRDIHSKLQFMHQEVDERVTSRSKFEEVSWSTGQSRLISRGRESTIKGRHSLLPFSASEEEAPQQKKSLIDQSFSSQTHLPEVIDINLKKKTMPCSPASLLPEEMEVDPTIPDLPDLDLTFDKPIKKAVGRKSMAGGRKSILPQWPEEKQQNVLKFFDSLNPSMGEQTQIALTCKFAAMQYDMELPSKLLYQWVGKKGREVHKSVDNFTLSGEDLKDTVLNFYNNLDSEKSETTRVAFTCKFVQAQFSQTLTSKQLFIWLKGSEKKSKK